MFINLPLSFPTDKFQELVGLPLKTTVFFVLCLGHTLGQQLGPPPVLFAPPLPKGFVEKAAPDTPLGYTVSVDVTAPEAFQDSLKSALLLELRKRPDVVITLLNEFP